MERERIEREVRDKQGAGSREQDRAEVEHLNSHEVRGL